MDQEHNPGESSCTIRRLDDSLINQIAAGEVVERPASVLKELCENSIDAMATSVSVYLQDGGMKKIQIVDDGIGMSPEDLVLSVERHTTSKLQSASDLEAIETFGFRGEALSSIASVSKLEIQTRRPDLPRGYCLEASFGTLTKDLTPVGISPGTTVTVSDLFAKVPARQKFLRSVGTEFSHCASAFKELALANPEIDFSIYHQGKLITRYSPKPRCERFLEVLKIPWAPLTVEDEQEDVRVEGFLSPGHLIRDRAELYLIVNGRSVRHRLLFSAIREAYRSTLGPHHLPLGILYLDVRAGYVDVNVHPQKLEVRFLRQEKLYSWITALIRKAISNQNTVVEWKSNALPTFSPLSEEIKVSAPEPRISSPSVLEPISSEPRPAPTREEKTAPPSLTPQPLLQWSPPQQKYRYLGQIRASYLLCEDEKGLLIFDQHALHEKLEFEKLKLQFEKSPLPVQQLLIPKILSLPIDLMANLEEHKERLHRAGFELEDFGDGDIAVKSRPAILSESEVEKTLTEMLVWLRELPQEEKTIMEKTARPILATIACHSVVRAKDKLDPVKANALVNSIEALEEGWTCPHGRPVLFRLPYPSIEKHFERK